MNPAHRRRSVVGENRRRRIMRGMSGGRWMRRWIRGNKIN